MSNKPTALVIDDEADLCRLMQITLTKMGVTCDVAYDLYRARELLEENTYDFCLTDLALPDGSGFEIVKLLSQKADTPVAVITAHGDETVAIEALKLGAFDFVNKPLELPRLRALVESALKARADIRANRAQPPKKTTIKSETPTTDTTPPQKSNDDILLDERLIGDSRPMRQLRTTIKKLARSQAPVFLWGGSGTGKEVVSRLIHDLSPRRSGNFVPVNCGAIPSELMESEFFGHKKGSFTGATSDKIGLFQQADGGTLFLDEVADLPLAMQVKLLRAIQEKTVRAIGDTKEVPVDIRIVCATHKDLADLVQKGAFRQDLFYRINVIEVKLPALNDRRDDIPMLARHFLDMIVKDWGLDPLTLTDDAIDALTYHDFKGNVRELRNILERAVTMSEGSEIDGEHLSLEAITPEKTEEIKKELQISKDMAEPKESDIHHLTWTEDSEVETLIFEEEPILVLNPALATTTGGGFSQKISPYHDNRPTYAPQPLIKENKPAQKVGLQISGTANYGTQKQSHPSEQTLPEEGLEAYLLEQEKQLITTAMHQAGGNKTLAAKLLGMSFRSLRYRLSKLGLDNDTEDDE
ncbi:sigma-54-dependent transcriptional regulator [Moraxella oblonga]|uniref:sigma-54-dependent transcriptional regulator n=1 Tax=Moraxella oblonga TaxID=200413 RepID=UPI00082BC1C7|nr:sigma-54 dependent transcriptional regulator [Moraxella oblonga]